MKNTSRNVKLLGVFIFLFPMYFWSSGLPQLSAIFFAAVFLAVGQNAVPFALRNETDILRPLALFTGYSFLVNGTWFLFLLATGTSRAPMFLFSIFYTYNLVVFSFVIFSLRESRPEHFRLVGITMTATVAAQVFISFFHKGGKGGRAEVLFNNPNQLGYFALLAATIIAVTAREQKRFFLIGVAGITGCLYLAALSLSKAAMIGCIFLIILLSVLQPKRILPLVLVLVAVIGPRIAESTLVHQVESRLNQVGDSNDDSADGRGYDRIYKYPQHLLLGAGEGSVTERFPDLPMYGEMHSSFGTVFFSYGIPGSILFFLFLFVIYSQVGFTRFIYLVPSLLYGLTHMGLRFTLFWVLLGYIVALSKHPISHGQLVRLKRLVP